jgi:hypothetical protein
LGGKVLQVLFGAATIADTEQLHQSIDELHEEQNNMALSGKMPVTLMKPQTCNRPSSQQPD